MRKLIILFLMVAGQINAQPLAIITTTKSKAVTYDFYISDSGDDANSGSFSSPFRSISKLSTVITGSKKTVGIKRGGTYYGSLTLTGKDTISFYAYGTGAMPILRSAKVVTSGITQNGNIYSYQDNSLGANINNVYSNGVLQTVARYQAYPYSFPTSVSYLSITDNNLTQADDYWDNCEIVYAAFPYANIRIRATNYASKTFTLQNNGQWNVDVNNRYFIQNHVGCLTENGQYAYNNALKTVYVYSNSTVNELIIPTGDAIFRLVNCHKISFNNIKFDVSVNDQISAYNCSNINISNCEFQNCGRHAVNLLSVVNPTIAGNNIHDIQGCGIFAQSTTNINILNNTIDKVAYEIGNELGWGTVDGYPSGYGISLIITEGALIQNNHVSNLGGMGIQSQLSSNVVIDKNYVSYFALHTNDAGGIYSRLNTPYYKTLYGLQTNNVSITNNIVDYCKTGDTIPLCPSTTAVKEGIYLDDFSESITITGNYVNGASRGMHVKGLYHNISDNTFIISKGATSYFNSTYGIIADNFQSQGWNNNTINNNTFIIDDYASASMWGMGTATFNGASSISYTNNKYYLPFNSQTGSNWEIIIGRTFSYFLASHPSGWTVTNEQLITPSLWANSSKSKTDYLYKIANPTNAVKTVLSSDLPYTDYIDLDGNVFGTSRTLSPYSALVLVRSEGAPPALTLSASTLSDSCASRVCRSCYRDCLISCAVMRWRK